MRDGQGPGVFDSIREDGREDLVVRAARAVDRGRKITRTKARDDDRVSLPRKISALPEWSNVADPAGSRPKEGLCQMHNS